MKEKLRVNTKKYRFIGFKGITLISLVITIIVLIILASVAIYLSLGNNGIFTRAKQAKEVTNKQEATDTINLKITTAQMNKYAEKQEMPNLQELADILYEDNEIEYVALETKVGEKEKITVGTNTSIYTKLNKYPYEFEINSSLQLASINGVKIATNETQVNTSPNSQNTMSYDEHFTGEYWLDERKIYEVTKEITLANTSANYNTNVKIEGIDNVIIDESKSFIHLSEYSYYPVNQYSSENSKSRFWYDIDSSSIYCSHGSAYNGFRTILTIRYTKISEKQNVE